MCTYNTLFSAECEQPLQYKVQITGTMDQQQAANGGAAAEFATEVAANPGDVLNGGQGNSTGTTSPTNNGLNNNEAKRAKLDPLKGGNGGSASPNAPSRVIHIRNIPNDVTEAEIIHLGIPFGRVTNVLVLKGKNQRFLTFDSLMWLPKYLLTSWESF